MLASGILLGGVFAPLITIPLLGGFSYFDYVRLMLQAREEWNLETWFTEGSQVRWHSGSRRWVSVFSECYI